MKSSYIAPAFYNVKEFSEMFACTEDHVRHGAKNYAMPGKSKHRAKLPEGYGAFQWSGVWIMFALSDKQAVAQLFNVKL